MEWRVVLHPAASDQLEKLPRDVDGRITSKIDEMVNNQWRDLLDYDVERVAGVKRDIYRARIGDYRVFFLCERPYAAILHVDRREGAYGNTDRLDERGADFSEE